MSGRFHVKAGWMILIGIMVFLFSCGSNPGPIERSSPSPTGRYILHVVDSGMVMNDTQTGTVKVVAWAGGGVGGHQFGIPFEQMKDVPGKKKLE